MVLLAFRHGLRAAEVCDLRWEQIDFSSATLHVRRIKHGTPATHPLTGREMRALRSEIGVGLSGRREPASISNVTLLFFLTQTSVPPHAQEQWCIGGLGKDR
jgi:integrase